MASSENNDLSLECPICSEIYRKPKILSCGHSFCSVCLQRMAQNALRVECPICRKVTCISSDGFQPNYGLHDAADAARKREEMKTKAINSVNEFHQKISTVCVQFNQKLQKWNKICELMNTIANKSFEMTETAESMDQQSLKDVETMKKIIMDIPSDLDHLQENRLLAILQQNRNNILIKDTSQLADLTEDLPALSLEDEHIGAEVSNELIGAKEGPTSNYVLIIGGDLDTFESSLELYTPYDGDNNLLLDYGLEHERSRFGHAAALLMDTVYVVGGFSDLGVPTLQSMELFDPVHHQYLGCGPEMRRLRQSFAAVAIQNQLMVFGGTEQCDYDGFSYCESFNTVTQTWSPLPNMEKARSSHCAVEFGGLIYVIGGDVEDREGISSRISSFVSIFNPKRSSWFFGRSMKQRRKAAAADKVGAGIVVTGGYDRNSQTLKDCEMLDPREKKWMDIAPMNQERYAHALVNYNGKLLAMGGKDIDNKPLSTVEEYDPHANQWRFVESLINQRVSFAVVTVP